MTRFNALKNKILTVMLAVPISVSALVMPVHAATPTIQGATLPVVQEWPRNDGGNTNVAYTLTPVGEVTEYGYTFNTEDAYNSGDVSYTIDADMWLPERGSFILAGNTKAEITFSWSKTGLYMFDLDPTTRSVILDDSRYTYDTTAYRIRLYAEDMNTAFFTVQNLDKTDSDDAGKVGEIIYTHQYIKQNNNDDGSGGDSDGSGSHHSKSADKNESSGSAKTNTNPGTGNTTDDEPIELIEKGNNKNPSGNGNGSNGVNSDANSGGTGANGGINTGDSSNIILYAGVLIGAAAVLAGWIIWKKRKVTNRRYPD